MKLTPGSIPIQLGSWFGILVPNTQIQILVNNEQSVWYLNALWIQNHWPTWQVWTGQIPNIFCIQIMTVLYFFSSSFQFMKYEVHDLKNGYLGPVFRLSVQVDSLDLRLNHQTGHDPNTRLIWYSGHYCINIQMGLVRKLYCLTI